MGRHRPIPPHPSWSVHTTPIGHWVILGPDGLPVLSHPDRVTRLHAVYLAAQAPPLLVAVEELTRTVEYLSSGYHRFTPLLEFAACTISLSKPPRSMVAQVTPFRQQGEIELDAA